MPEEVPRTWILTLRDRSMSPKRQRSYIDELGGVDAVFCVDTCHDVMYSEPGPLAQILVQTLPRSGATLIGSGPVREIVLASPGARENRGQP